MRPTPVLLSFLVLVAAPVGAQSAQRRSTSELRASIDSFVGARVAEDAFSGAVVVARGNDVIYQRALGLANRETNATMRLDTKLQIASTTKLYTQIAIRQLEQAGKLSLSDTVGKFLPDYPNAVVRSVEQLLQHRSGIGSFWNDRFMANPSAVRSIRDYMDLFQNDSLLFEPGTSQAYSNGGYVLLGAIIERVSGREYHDYVRENIFRVAGMTETGPFDSRNATPNAAVGYTRQPMEMPAGGDKRLAGPVNRPGDPITVGPAPQPQAGGGTMRMRIIGPDGKELSPEDARVAIARRAAESGPRRVNTGLQEGLSGAAGNDYSTAGDFLKLARALLDHKLLDKQRTDAVLGARYAGGADFRANGGGPGVNAEFSIFPTGEVMIVLSNYDPPSATTVATFIRTLF
jgi:CubicO group peptidase (beta-lactamase class C family)